MTNRYLYGLLFMLFPTLANANEVGFSLSSGWPFLLNPSISIKHQKIEYYANYKIGLDDGFSLGAEAQLGLHTFGMFVGAIGTRKTRVSCETNATCQAWQIMLTDQKTTQGVGISYEYRFLPSRKGWALRLETGYGQESRNNTKRVDANVQVVYHF